jgi:phospho-N-acetylmuramoyl-pentapeptide-transferase
MKETALALSLGGFTFMITVIWGGPLIRVLRMLNLGEQIRIDVPRRHFTKLGTPTMGGWLVVIPVLLVTGSLNIVSILGPLSVLGRSIILPIFVLLANALLGTWDDWKGIRGRVLGEGLRARAKFLWQVLIALVAALVLKYGLDAPNLFLPNFPEEISLGIWYVPIALFVIVGTGSAVNLTDGLDGLAGLIAATAFAAYGAIAMLQGQVFLVRFCFTIVGALFAFLWYNAHPAELFMGDTGSLALGSTLAVVALMTGQWPLLVLIAIIPFATTLSVIMQVVYFKLSKGRRLFKMTPIHHHFELIGWSETQIVQRFWLVALLSTMIGIALALI